MKQSAHRCDLNKQVANSTKCHAADQKCKSCGKTGQFAKARSSGQKHTVKEKVICELTMLFLKNAAPVEKKIMCTVGLGTCPNMQPFEMIVDTVLSFTTACSYI